jgi:tetratricopeptide (TPR) repeat protein
MKAGDLAVRASFQVSLTGLGGPVAGLGPIQVFGLLGLWAGPFIGIGAAAALVGAYPVQVDEALEALVDACLLESPAPDRYRFHDLLRVYAAECAQVDEIRQQRHGALRRVSEWYLYTVDAAASCISPHRTWAVLDPPPADCHPLAFDDLDQALEWCEAERPNLVAVTEQAAADGMDEIAWRLPAAALPFFKRRGHRDDWIATHRIGLESTRRLGDRGGEAVILHNLGMAFHSLDADTEASYLRQAIAIHRETGDLRGEAQATVSLTHAYLGCQRYVEIIEERESLLAIQQRAASRHCEGSALNNVGEAYLGLGQLDAAISFLTGARRVFHEIADEWGEGFALANLGEAYLLLHQPDEALGLLKQGAATHHAIGERAGEGAALKRLGSAYRAVGQPDRARSALQQAYEIFQALGDEAEAASVRSELGA